MWGLTNARVFQHLSNATIVFGVLLLITGVLLPYYKTPQRMAGSGPRAQYAPYTVSTYIVPPVDKGTPISLDFLADKPGATTLLLAPFDSQQLTINLPTILYVTFGPNQKGIVFFATAPKSGPYLLMITSYNSSFQFHLNSVWSPFYQYRGGATTLGIFVIFAGLISLYYYEYKERRDQMMDKALRDLLHKKAADHST